MGGASLGEGKAQQQGHPPQFVLHRPPGLQKEVEGMPLSSSPCLCGAPSPHRGRQGLRSGHTIFCPHTSGVCIDGHRFRHTNTRHVSAVSLACTHMHSHTSFFPPLPLTVVSGMATSINEDGVNRWVAKLQVDDVAFPRQERSCWKLFLVGQTRIKGNAKSQRYLEPGPSLSLGAEPSIATGKAPLPWVLPLLWSSQGCPPPPPQRGWSLHGIRPSPL